ncbi:MAG: hypothetical protein ACFFAU_12385 [Candidatus Hodarchaeota archaeon]
MPNKFITRKYGRWTFGIGICLLYTILLIIYGFLQVIFIPEIQIHPLDITQPDFDFLHHFASYGGIILMLIITEIVSNWNYTLFHELLESDIFQEDKEKMKGEIEGLLWHNGVYLLFIVFYFIPPILTFINSLLGFVPLHQVVEAFFTLLVAALLFAEMFWVISVPVILILLLPRKNLKPDVFNSDGSLGFAPIANYLLKISLMITLFGSSTLYWITTAPSKATTPEALEATLLYSSLVLMVVIIVPILYFIVPTIGLNRSMKKAKFEVLNDLNKDLKEIYKTKDWKNTSMQNLISLIREVERKNEWPFSMTGIRNLITSFLLPIGIFLFNNVDTILAVLTGD